MVGEEIGKGREGRGWNRVERDKEEPKVGVRKEWEGVSIGRGKSLNG